jgi:hypothetical protein
MLPFSENTSTTRPRERPFYQAAIFFGSIFLVSISSYVLTVVLERIGTGLRLTEGLLGVITALAADSPEISSSITALMSGHHQQRRDSRGQKRHRPNQSVTPRSGREARAEKRAPGPGPGTEAKRLVYSPARTLRHHRWQSRDRELDSSTFGSLQNCARNRGCARHRRSYRDSDAIAAVRLATRGRGSAVETECFNSNTLNIVFGICLPAMITGLGNPSGRAFFALGWLGAMTILSITLLIRGARGATVRGSKPGRILSGFHRPDCLLALDFWVRETEETPVTPEN